MRDSQNSIVRFDLLGPVRAVYRAAPISLGPWQQQAIGAVLVLSAGRQVGRDQLIDALWADRAPDYAVNLVQKYISGIRRALTVIGPDRPQIQWTGSGYLLDVPRSAVDVNRAGSELAAGHDQLAAGQAESALAHLDAGLALWTGTPFDGLSAPLLVTERERLAELRMSGVQDRIGALLQLGRYSQAVTELTALVREHPLREGLWESLILALFRTGRQAEALATYQRIRQLLAEELGADPGSRLQDLQRAILVADPTLNLPSLPGPSDQLAAAVDAALPLLTNESAGRLTPAQLPPKMRNFVGRVRPQQVLDEAVDRDEGELAGTRIVVVTGTAGAGKSALALHWAHDARRRFPDGQLYVNLRGFDPSDLPLDPTDVTRQFVEALRDNDDELPATPAGLTALYRSLVADRRLLVVLDNARDLDQVRPLLPGSPHCFVLVTSRNRLTGLVLEEGAQSLPLDLFTPAESHDLLTARLGPDRLAAAPDSVAEIVLRCSRLPLALAIVAARAAEHPDFALAAIAAELRQGGSRLDPFASEDASVQLRVVFSCSYAELSPEAARLFRFVGLSQTPELSARAAAGLCAVTDAQALTLLTELSRLNLLTEVAPGRYAVHDLLRAYAAELAAGVDTAADRDAAVRRLLEQYWQTAANACRHLASMRGLPAEPAGTVPGIQVTTFPGREEAMSWLEAEQGSLYACWLHALDVDVDLGWQLAAAFGLLLEARADWMLLHDVMAMTIPLVEVAGSLPVQAYFFSCFGQTLIQLDRHGEAQTMLRQSLVCYQKLGDLTGQSRLHRVLAWSLQREHRESEAIRHARLGVTIAESLGDSALGIALNALGWFLALDGQMADALVECNRALALQEQVGEPLGQAETLDSIGLIQFGLGRVEDAVASYLRSARLFSELGDTYNCADTLVNLGDGELRVGRTADAVGHWTEALHILERLGERQAMAVRQRILDAQLPVGRLRDTRNDVDVLTPVAEA